MASPVNKRGSVIKVRLDPTEGREQAGTRPAVVISSTFINERSQLLVVVPVTSRKLDKVYPFEAQLDHTTCGLEVPSKIMANQVRTIDKSRVIGVYGVVDEGTMAQINEAIKITLGIVELD